MRPVCQRWIKNNPGKAAAAFAATRKLRKDYYLKKNREYALLKKYGIEQADYEAMLHRQNGACAICKRTDTGHRNTKHFSIDHNHKTGEVRGLLCQECNYALGAGRESPEILRAMIAYLALHG